MTKELKIRSATKSDYNVIWNIFHDIIVAGETYPLNSNISRQEALAYWYQQGAQVYVEELDRKNRSSFKTEPEVVGSYTLHTNQSGGGGHVANAAFIVAPHARGSGVGRAMGKHCLSEARRLGFKAMQFNFVVSTNEQAVKLWQDLGMKIIGTLPGAFRHPVRGYVDVYVMFQQL